MSMNKTHLGALLLGTGVFLGLTGAALVVTDRRENETQETEESDECECECRCHQNIPTMSTDTVE